MARATTAWLVVGTLALCGCAGWYGDDLNTSGTAQRPEGVEVIEAAITIGEAGGYIVDDVAVPSDFTGCVNDTGICFVLGRPVDAVARFEPQSGRTWFLDPNSGNTYYADGELRTGDAFRARMALELYREGGGPQGDELRIGWDGEVPGDTETDAAVDEDELPAGAIGGS